MSTSAIARYGQNVPSVFNEFFKPWNEWFDNDNLWGKVMNIPPVNIVEQENEYKVSLAAPGLKKEDFKIDVNGNIMTISCEQEERKEEKDTKYSRREYSYTSFSRSFTLPEEISQDKILATYENGVLNVSLPRKMETNKNGTRQIEVK